MHEVGVGIVEFSFLVFFCIEGSDDSDTAEAFFGYSVEPIDIFLGNLEFRKNKNHQNDKAGYHADDADCCYKRELCGTRLDFENGPNGRYRSGKEHSCDEKNGHLDVFEVI